MRKREKWEREKKKSEKWERISEKKKRRQDKKRKRVIKKRKKTLARASNLLHANSVSFNTLIAIWCTCASCGMLYITSRTCAFIP